jgi:hypothetical protein
MYDDRFSDTAPSPETTPQPAPTMSDADRRFVSCRWHKPADPPQPAHCTHREVLPMAGAHGFSPDSWCPDCRFYKLRRVPRKNAFDGR